MSLTRRLVDILFSQTTLVVLKLASHAQLHRTLHKPGSNLLMKTTFELSHCFLKLILYMHN